MTEEVKITWACPGCSAVAHKHGKGGAKECQSRHHDCDGFICQCDPDVAGFDDEDHGTSFAKVCHNAECEHCGWSGAFPQKPKGLQAWEKKALEAGWAPPAKRAKELGITLKKT